MRSFFGACEVLAAASAAIFWVMAAATAMPAAGESLEQALLASSQWNARAAIAAAIAAGLHALFRLQRAWKRRQAEQNGF